MTGGERMTLHLISGMQESAFEPVFLTQRRGPLAEASIDSGISTIILPLPALLDRYDGEILRYSGFKKLRAVADLISYNRELARILKEQRISGVWCSNIRALLTVGVTAKLMRIPIVWNIWLARSFGRRTRLIYDVSCLLATHIVTEYRAQPAKVFSKLTLSQRKSKFSTIYTGIDKSFFDLQRQEGQIRRSRQGTLELISCCRITPRKDVGCLLEAVRILDRKGRKIHITIIGSPFSEADNIYYSDLLAKVERDRTDALVSFLPWNDDVRCRLVKADVYVSASSDEGLPGAIREAQAVGLPVIATDAGGTREALLNQETGIIVPCRDPEALANAIETLERDPLLSRRFGAAARRRAAELFSIERFIDCYAKVFSEVLKVPETSAISSSERDDPANPGQVA